MPRMTTLVHPTFPDVFVKTSKPRGWRDAGWRTSSASEAEAAGVEDRDAEEAPVGATSSADDAPVE